MKKKYTQKQVDHWICIGTQMSNVLYNIKQQETIDLNQWRDTFDELVKAWEKAI